MALLVEYHRIFATANGGMVRFMIAVKDILNHAFERPASAWPAVPLQSPAASGAGPP
jgi:hypothetical protein